MTTEPKIPPLPEPEGMDVGMYYYAETVQLLYKQWAERVAALERVLDVAREALVQAKQNTTHGQIAWNCKEAIAAIDAARSKEGG